MPHRNPALPLAALVLSTLAWPADDALAQVAPQQNVPLRRRAPSEPVDVPTVDVVFPGGTVADYILVLRDRLPELNVVVDPDAAEVAMPPVSLKRVTAATALDLIQATAAARESQLQVDERLDRDRRGTGVFVVTLIPQRGLVPMAVATTAPHGRRAREAKQLFVSSLRDVVDGTETVLTAIDTALGIQEPEEGEKAVVKFHADSGLLIVHGTDDQIATVTNVLSAMQRHVTRRGQVVGAVGAPVGELTELRASLASLRAEVEALRAELKALKKTDEKPKEP